MTKGRTKFRLSKAEWQTYVDQMRSALATQERDMNAFVKEMKTQFGQYVENEFGPECP